METKSNRTIQRKGENEMMNLLQFITHVLIIVGAISVGVLWVIWLINMRKRGKDHD